MGLPRRPRLPRWPLTSSVMEPSAPEAAAPMLDGTAALMACTVLLLLLTAHLLPRRPRLPRWLPTSSVMEPSAPETAAQMACTALPPLLTAHLLLRSSIISRGLLQK